MEKFLNLTISLILSVVALGFQSCGNDDGKEEPDAPLSLSQATLSMKKGENKNVKISGGTGDYRISVYDDFYINANVIGTELCVIAKHVGSSTVAVHSGSSTQNITVTIESDYPEVNIPFLNWGSSMRDIADKVDVSKQGTHQLGYKYIEVSGKSPVWSDETYYFKDDKLIAVQSNVRQNFKSAGTPILIVGERFQPVNKTFQGYNTYDWFEKPNETKVRLCTSRYGNGYTMEVWYSTTDQTIELLSKAY